MNRLTGKEMAIIVPTKDRPGKMKNLLDSVVAQQIKCGQIIIVDGGRSIKNLVQEYDHRLSIDYYICRPPGQIRQRNLAISKLRPEIELVAFLDDDLVLEERAIEAMLEYWGQVEKKTAGISFNIVNNPPYHHHWYTALVGMSSKRMGRILKSGYNVPISPVSQNIRSQWLCGGATVWRKEILTTYINTEVRSRWAICEDISFSYPIGKRYPLFVCANARVRHEHVYDHNVTVDHFYYGRTVTLWRLYFVEANKDLSMVCFFYMMAAQILTRISHGTFRGEKDQLEYALGQLKGLQTALKCLFKKQSIKYVLEENTD